MVLAAGVSGCTSTGADMAVVEPTVGYAIGDETPVSLPDTMAVLPSPYSGPSPSGASFTVAALPKSDAAASAIGPQAVTQPTDPQAKPIEPDAFAAAKGANVFPPPPPAPAVAAAPDASATPDQPRGEIEKLIAKYAALYEVPETLVRRVVRRESTFNPKAYNRGHWGLMQIKHATARGMGYLGSAKGLLDAETNLKYAVKYLRGAWLVAQGDQERADRLYQRGYYYDAKRMGLLDETGLGRDRRGRTRSPA